MSCGVDQGVWDFSGERRGEGCVDKVRKNKMMEETLPKNWAVRFFTIFTGQAFSLFGSSLV